MSFVTETGNLLRELLKALFDPYRPEMHYMRGAGAKGGTQAATEPVKGLFRG